MCFRFDFLRVVSYVSFFFFYFPAFSQDIENTYFDVTLYNKFDINNKKTGVWITINSGVYSVSMYVDGKRNGSALSYMKIYDGSYKLMYLRNYHNDKLKNWIRFIDREYYFVIDSIRVNNSLIKKQKLWTNIDTLYESYCWNFKNGRLEDEGWLIYPENLELDSEDVGLWKVYDEKGNMRIEERGKNVIPNYKRFHSYH